MHKLHTATGPSRAVFFTLRNCTSSASALAPFTAVGESAPFGIMPWSSFTEHSIQATTRREPECIQSHIAGASPNLTLVSFAFGGL